MTVPRQDGLAGRRARRQRAQLLVLSIISALTLVAASGSWVLASYVSGRLSRVNAGTSGTPASGPVNILVAGIDTRSGLTRQQEIELHVGNDVSMNSDTLMLVHISADHDRVQEISLPRDSWVDIPGHGMNKINAAIGIGGPPLMVKTVEQATGLVINDYIEVDFLGFVKVIDALGGVNICLPFAVDDSYTGLHMSAGVHHVDGVTALKFARDRHSFAASDLARIDDQQQLLSSLFTEATTAGILANPFRLQEFVSSLTSAVTVDSGFNLVRLADELRGIRSEDITFTTVPIATASYMAPDGQEAVLWDTSAARALFESLKNDTAPAKTVPAARKRTGEVSRSRVSVDVYNGDQRPVGQHRQEAGRARFQCAPRRPELDAAQCRAHDDPVPVRPARRGPAAAEGAAGRHPAGSEAPAQTQAGPGRQRRGRRRAGAHPRAVPDVTRAGTNRDAGRLPVAARLALGRERTAPARLWTGRTRPGEE
jgi:LCP family protein required for cell wall assembly